MSKKLKIKFWKAEKALAMQILEQEGLPKRKANGDVQISTIPDIYHHTIYLRGERVISDLNVDAVYFECNQERDRCLNRLTQAITYELFTGTGELKVGELCEAWNDGECDSYRRVYAGKVAKQLGVEKRHLVRCIHDADVFMRFENVKPIEKRTEPKVETNGEIITYTWEEE